MPQTNETGFECRDCHKPIGEGETMWSVNVHCEALEAGVITVHQADGYHVYCETCAGNRDFSRIRIPLKTENESGASMHPTSGPVLGESSAGGQQDTIPIHAFTDQPGPAVAQVSRQAMPSELSPAVRSGEGQAVSPQTTPPSKPARLTLASRKFGRNAPCYCGSGRKHKRCCGQWRA